jgi:glycosyltransferase involved in cell wall biosynthesis
MPRGSHSFIFQLKIVYPLIKAIPNVMLLVVGDGPDKEKLKNKAKELGIKNHIIWMGRMDHEEVIKLYTIMDVVVIPSRFEGFGLSAAEAMAAGVPVIASAVDGLMEIIEDGKTGYLVPVNNSGELAQALIKLLNNPERAQTMGLNGAERVKKMFSFEHFSESTLAAYQYFTCL